MQGTNYIDLVSQESCFDLALSVKNSLYFNINYTLNVTEKMMVDLYLGEGVMPNLYFPGDCVEPRCFSKEPTCFYVVL